jgi:tRNA A-37 threonylcarbamoyl transferase component Bud32
MFVRFFRCVVKAALVNVPKALLEALPFGNAIGDFARDAIRNWKEQTPEPAERRAEVQELVAASTEEVRREAEQAVAAVAADQPEPMRRALVSYLAQLPGTVRQSLRCVADPTGRTVPAQLSVDRAEDVLSLLPVRPPRFQPGMCLGDWVLEELLGVGGFGEVWKATNPHLPPVALKFCTDATAAKALRNEAALLGRVIQQGRHPGIVALLDTNLNNNPPFLKYEYVAGGDLSRLIRSWVRLPVARLVDKSIHLMRKLADIIGFAHRHGIVHRDLKPANILLQPTAAGGFSLRVADFGIGGVSASRAMEQARIDTTRGAVLTEALRGACTPLYASPQQMRGEPPDPRDDIHALGIIWLQVLTGDMTVRVSAEWRDELVERGIPGPVLDVLGKCLATKAERRFASATDLATELTRVSQATESGLEADATDYRWARLRGGAQAFLEKRAPERIAIWRRAAEWGAASGQWLLGSCLCRGAGVAQDEAEGVGWLRKAAEQGHDGAQCGLGYCYMNGTGVARDEAEGLSWYRKAANQGDAGAQFNLGWCCQNGLGIA